MLKRCFDFTLALIGLLISSPLLLAVAVAIWLQDYGSPFYIAVRAARHGGSFKMIKLRSMVINADRIGGTTTAANDHRITPIGHFVRTYKIDELMQLLNVIWGDMSLVGPRPQTIPDALLYTAVEKRILTVRPGLTDIASIVFADEGEILRGSLNSNLLYNQVIRPWKSRLALLYIDHQSFATDLRLILTTLTLIVSRRLALRSILNLLKRWRVDSLLLTMASREGSLLPYPPPGASEVFAFRFSAQ